METGLSLDSYTSTKNGGRQFKSVGARALVPRRWADVHLLNWFLGCFWESVRLSFAKNGFPDGLRAPRERAELIWCFNDIRDADEVRRRGELSENGIGSLVRFLIFRAGGSWARRRRGVGCGAAKTIRATHTRRVTRVERLAGARNSQVTEAGANRVLGQWGLIEARPSVWHNHPSWSARREGSSRGGCPGKGGCEWI